MKILAMMNDKNIYLGASGLLNYLSNHNKPYIPIVELNQDLNPFLESHNIHMSVKLMNTLPLNNVKSLPADNLLSNLDCRNKNIIESSSGNTVFSMGILANKYGVKKVKALASKNVSKNKLNLLRLANIDIEIIDGPMCPDAKNPESSINIAKKVASDNKGWINPGQYDNKSNPDAHYKITGPEIFEQLDDKISTLVVGLGTTGTALGTARFLKEKNSDINIFGAVRKANNSIPGVRTRKLLSEIKFNWKSLLEDNLIEVEEKDAYRNSLEMIRNGLLVGPSAGMALAAAKIMIKQKIEDNDYMNLQGKHIVFIAPDSCFPYVDEYFEVLSGSDFPEIIDANGLLLKSENKDAYNNICNNFEVNEISAEVVHKYRDSFFILDVRDENDFNEHHIDNSVNIPYFKIEDNIDDIRKSKKPIVVVCSRIALSIRASHKLKSSFDVDSIVMKGGFVAWTNLGYERIKSSYCINTKN